MKVNSTGLGKTTMVAHFAELASVDDEGLLAMRLNIEATEPVHWSIKATVGGDDLRAFAKFLLKPSVLWRALQLVFSGHQLNPPKK
jgi:hypothetical protein